MPEYDMVPTVELFVELPTFSRTWGGYQPEAVDEALTEISKELDAERERVFTAQQRLMEAEAVLETLKGPATFDHLAAAANKIISDAGRAATEIIREADLRVRDVMVRIDAQAAELIATAERRAAEHTAEADTLRANIDRQRAQSVTEAEQVAGPIRAKAEAEAALVRQEAFDAVELLMGELLARRDTVALDIGELEERRRRAIERLELSRNDVSDITIRLRVQPPGEQAAEIGSVQELKAAFSRDGETQPDARRAGDTPKAPPATGPMAPPAEDKPQAQPSSTEGSAAPAGQDPAGVPTVALPAASEAKPAAVAVAGDKAAPGHKPAAGRDGAATDDPWAAAPPSAGAPRQAGSGKRRVRPSGAPQQGRAGRRG